MNACQLWAPSWTTTLKGGGLWLIDSSAAEGPVCSYDPLSEPNPDGVGTFFFFLEACRGDCSLSTVRSMFRPLGVGVILRSRTARGSGCLQGSTIMQSGEVDAKPELQGPCRDPKSWLVPES